MTVEANPTGGSTNPTGEAAKSGSALAGDAGKQGSTTTETSRASALGSEAGEGEKKPEGKEQGQPSGDKKGAEAGGELEITLPEGTKVDQKLLDGFKPMAKELGLDSPKASKLAAWYAEQAKVAEKAQVDAWRKQGDDWAKANETDPDIGGTKYPETLANARKGIQACPNAQKLRAELDKYGMGDNPELLRAFAFYGAANKEDNSQVDKARGAPPRKLTHEEKVNKFYGLQK